VERHRRAEAGGRLPLPGEQSSRQRWFVQVKRPHAGRTQPYDIHMIVLKGQPTGHPVRRSTRRRPLIFALVGQLAARLGSLRRPGGS
jgi:hypothetical protein